MRRVITGKRKFPCAVYRKVVDRETVPSFATFASVAFIEDLVVLQVDISRTRGLGFCCGT